MIKSSKTNLLIIVPIVVLIWGYIFLNLLGVFNGNDIPEQNQVSVVYKKPNYQSREKFALIPTSRDPFFGTFKQPTRKNSSSKKDSKTQSDIPWPQISYHGIVSDNNSASTIFVVSIGGVQHLLQKGENVSDVVLKSGNDSSVSLKFHGETKTFSIQ